MFARALTQSGLRASLRMPQSSLRALHTAPVPRARLAVTMPATQRMLAQRHMSAMAKKDLGDVHEGNDVRRGFDEVVPFLKRIPVDVFPLVAFVSFVLVLGVFFSAKNIMTDKTLRLKPAHMTEEEE